MLELPKLSAERWVAEAEAGSQLLTATGHLQRHLHEAFAAEQGRRGRIAWSTPTILTWQAWLERQHHERVLSGEAAGSDNASGNGPGVLLRPSQTAALWQQVIGAAAGPGQRAGDLLYPSGLAAQAEEAWRLLHAWEMKLSTLEAQAATPEEQRFAAWAKAYAALTDRSGWTDRARLPREVAAWIEAAGATDSPATGAIRRVVLAGFDGLEPAQERVIAALQGAGWECFELESPVRGAAVASGTLQRVACTDPDAEIEAAARWARAQLDAVAAEPSTTEQGITVGIVVQGLAARANQVARSFRAQLAPLSALPTSFRSPEAPPFHVSAAPPLAQSPLVRAALRMLRLDARAIHGGIDLAELEAVLLSPYFGGATAERQRRGMLAVRLRGLGDAAVTLGTVTRFASAECPTLSQRLKDVVAQIQAIPARQSFAAWALSFTGQLRALGWPGHGNDGRSLGSVEFQTHERWRDLLDELCGFDLVLQPTERGEALARLEALAAEATFQPKTDPAPVQIVGHLEAAGLAFDRLWVMGLDDESWPRPTQPHPFLPLGMQRARGLPRASAERELAFAERVTARLKQSADHAIFSHAATHGAAKLRPSPLLADLPEVAVEAIASLGQTGLADAIRRSAMLEPRVESPLRPLAAGTAVGSGTRLFEDMAACPFRAQAAHRLGAEDAALPEPGLNPADHGSLLHAALQVFWATVKTQAALADFAKQDPATLDALIIASLKRALDEFVSRHGRLSPGLRALEGERLARLIRDLLERERLTRPAFTVEASEEPLTAGVGGIALKMRIDRVDTLADGSRLFLDYKTGRVSTAGWLSDRPDAPQLPLYAITHTEPPSALAFIQVRTGETKMAGVSAGDTGILGVEPSASWRAGQAGQAGATWGELMAGWRRVLDTLGERFRAGEANVDPKAASACAYCPLPGLCRINELGALARGDADTAASEGNSAVALFDAAGGRDEG